VSMELLEDLEGNGKAKKEGPSLVVFLVVCAVITLIAGGAGFGVSATVLKPVTMAPPEDVAAEPAVPETSGAPKDAHGAAAEHDAPAEHAKAGGLPADVNVIDIAPITTNLVDPEDAWIRMELSLAFEGAADDGIAEEIHQDILAYVHTMKLYNLRGGSGFQHLMEDLNERAAIRSDGRVKRVLVRSFILE